MPEGLFFLSSSSVERKEIRTHTCTHTYTYTYTYTCTASILPSFLTLTFTCPSSTPHSTFNTSSRQLVCQLDSISLHRTYTFTTPFHSIIVSYKTVSSLLSHRRCHPLLHRTSPQSLGNFAHNTALMPSLPSHLDIRDHDSVDPRA